MQKTNVILNDLLEEVVDDKLEETANKPFDISNLGDNEQSEWNLSICGLNHDIIEDLSSKDKSKWTFDELLRMHKYVSLQLGQIMTQKKDMLEQKIDVKELDTGTAALYKLGLNLADIAIDAADKESKKIEEELSKRTVIRND